MAKDIASLKRMVQEGGAVSRDLKERRVGDAPLVNMRLQREYKHRDGLYRWIPRGWDFPKLPLQNTYLY